MQKEINAENREQDKSKSDTSKTQMSTGNMNQMMPQVLIQSLRREALNRLFFSIKKTTYDPFLEGTELPVLMSNKQFGTEWKILHQ